MAVKIRRSYKGAAVSAVLDSSGVTSATQTAITLSTSPSTWPTGKFFVVVAPGTAQEEKMCVTVSGSTLTVVDPAVSSTAASANGRGADNTTARSTIAGGATVYPVFTAVDADEANELTSTYANQGGIVYQGASTFAQLAIGTAGQVLKVNSGATAPEWGQVATAGIADSAVTADKISSGAVTSAKIADGTIVAGDIADSTITLAKLASAVANALVPVGTIAMYGGASAPTGWLLCNGTSTTGYPTLAGIVGSTTPDLRGRFAIGDNATLTLLGTGGSATISTSNLPSHSHSIDHDHAAANTEGMSANATLNHSVTDPGHDHDLSVTQVATAVAHAHDNNNDYASAGSNGFSTRDQNNSVRTATTGISVAAHDVSHTHSFNMPAFTGTSGTAGSGADYYPPYLVVNYIIKHD